MNRNSLIEQIRKKESFLCVGLDSDISRLPSHYNPTPESQLDFNLKIIESTLENCVAYKINTAFYEVLGSEGWKVMEKTIEAIPDNILIIADAKRGDIGNTSRQYAKAFFETLNFDAITVAPYMGQDSIEPFLEFRDKWVIVLGLTSNSGSSDFQYIQNDEGYLFEKVISRSSDWGNKDNLMFVVGATHPDELIPVRKIIPDHFILVPGIGVQGGSLEAVCRSGLNKDCGLLVNSSRGIIFADSTENFANIANLQSKSIQQQMSSILKKHQILI